MRGDRDHLRRRPVRGGPGVAGHRAHGVAGVPLPAARAARRHGCRRDDRLPDRRAGQFDGGRALRLHRRADGIRQAQRQRRTDFDGLVPDRRARVRCPHRRRAGRDGPAAAPDLRCHNGKRGRTRRVHGPDAFAGGRGRPQAIRRRGPALLAVGTAGLLRVRDHDGLADRLVGPVSSVAANARTPRCAQTGRVGRQ